MKVFEIVSEYQDTIAKLIQEAQRIGFKETSIQHDPNTIRHLLTVFKRLGIKTMGELETLFHEAEEKRTDFLQDIYQVISRKSVVPIDYPFPIFIFVLIFLRLNTVSLEAIDVKEIILKLLGSAQQTPSEPQ
jgi:hypothetical protein